MKPLLRIFVASCLGVGAGMAKAVDSKPAVSKPVPKPTAARVNLSPADSAGKDKYIVSLASATPEAIIRYSLDGVAPTAESGTIYTKPIEVTRTCTLVAVAFKDSLPPSPAAWATYFIGEKLKPGFETFHLGNSLTGTAGRFGMYARAAGYDHLTHYFLRGGALTKRLWENEVITEKKSWNDTFDKVKRIDLFTVQPRDFVIDEEAAYDVKFWDLARARSPEMQPWIYVEWDERDRRRWTDQGAVPSSQVSIQWPAATWEESMSAMLLYGEELEKRLKDVYKEPKQPRIIPAGIAMGWIHHMIEKGQVAGLPPGSFNPVLFGGDGVHPNANGAFLVDCTWFSAFYRESPEGKVPPIGTDLTGEQASIMQRLAWDTIKNYPDCGLYVEGSAPVAKPACTPSAVAISDITPVTLSSTTPGTWFRYTLDGTEPTRTRGLVYCGVVSVRPGMTLKAVGYKSGMADSTVSEFVFPASPGNRVLASVNFRGAKGAAATHPLDLTLTGPFAPYLRHGGDRKPDAGLWAKVLSIAPISKSLWASGVAHCQSTDDTPMELRLGSQGADKPSQKTEVAAGFCGKDCIDAHRQRCWGLRVDDKVVRSTVVIDAAHPATLVLRLSFPADPQASTKLSLFVNPPGTMPTTPDATIDLPPFFEWRTIGVHTIDSAKDSFDEVRVAESFEGATGKQN